MSQRFDRLRETLLRAGIAPRHVRRYVAELRDHFDDLVREETARGLQRDQAVHAAHARIGEDDALVATMLARPELRSLAARFPWAVFGFGPVLMLVLIVAAALVIQGTIFLNPTIPRSSLAWARPSFDAFSWFATYAAPLFIAIGLCIVGIRQRMAAFWIVLGLIVACIFGGFHHVGVTWPDAASRPPELGISFALAPPFPRDMILFGCLRAAISCALAGAVYWLWRRREFSAST